MEAWLCRVPCRVQQGLTVLDGCWQASISSGLLLLLLLRQPHTGKHFHVSSAPSTDPFVHLKKFATSIGMVGNLCMPWLI